MSLAVDFLSEFFARGETTQTDFARAAGMTPTNVTDLLKGDVAISGRNLDKLLRGLRTEKDRKDFLTAFLRDQIPADYADDITIQLQAHKTEGALEDPDDAGALEGQMILAFASLPSDLHRRRLVHFAQTLRGDAKLRDLFARTMAYLEEEKGSGLARETLSNRSSPRDAEAEEQRRVDAELRRAEAEQSLKPRSPRAPKRSAKDSAGAGAGG
jgi:transcriptional regulator with XRE-family HTH domain